MGDATSEYGDSAVNNPVKARRELKKKKGLNPPQIRGYGNAIGKIKPNNAELR